MTHNDKKLGTAVMISQGEHSRPARDRTASFTQHSLPLETGMSAISRVREYYQLLTEGGPSSRFAEFFHLPAALIIENQKTEFRTLDDVCAFYERLRERYRSHGIREVTFDEAELSTFQIHPWFTLVKIIAIARDADGSVEKHWTCSYMVRELDGVWKFDLVTAVAN
jgi:hypothetical protein